MVHGTATALDTVRCERAEAEKCPPSKSNAHAKWRWMNSPSFTPKSRCDVPWQMHITKWHESSSETQQLGLLHINDMPAGHTCYTPEQPSKNASNSPVATAMASGSAEAVATPTAPHHLRAPATAVRRCAALRATNVLAAAAVHRPAAQISAACSVARASASSCGAVNATGSSAASI